MLRPTGCILKVNDLAMWMGIERLLPELMVYGRVMLDLKLHEIPNTVENLCRRLRHCPPWAVTVHASGAGEMVQAARSTLPHETSVLAVTVLTSLEPDTCEEVYCRRPLEEVLALAKIAWDGNANGFVCSPEEVAPLRAQYPEALIVVPGVRSEGIAQGDQKRTGTPEAIIAAGANHLVMGREITGSAGSVATIAAIRAKLPQIQSFAT